MKDHESCEQESGIFITYERGISPQKKERHIRPLPFAVIQRYNIL